MIFLQIKDNVHLIGNMIRILYIWHELCIHKYRFNNKRQISMKAIFIKIKTSNHHSRVPRNRPYKGNFSAGNMDQAYVVRIHAACDIYLEWSHCLPRGPSILNRCRYNIHSISHKALPRFGECFYCLGIPNQMGSSCSQCLRMNRTNNDISHVH